MVSAVALPTTVITPSARETEASSRRSSNCSKRVTADARRSSPRPSKRTGWSFIRSAFPPARTQGNERTHCSVSAGRHMILTKLSERGGVVGGGVEAEVHLAQVFIRAGVTDDLDELG